MFLSYGGASMVGRRTALQVRVIADSRARSGVAAPYNPAALSAASAAKVHAMELRILAAAVLGAFWVAGVPAQNATLAPDQSVMDRIQREADGPRRRILEAATRSKTAVRPADTSAPGPAAVRLAAPSAVGAPDVGIGTLPPAAEPLAVAETTIATVPAVVAPETAPEAVAMVDLGAPAAATAAPRLLSKVDPQFPPSPSGRGMPRTEVLVELVVNRDGSVSDAAMRSASSAELESVVLKAVRQWRYEAQPEPRSHLVRLVVTPG
jgi:TonB family protein